MKELILFLSGAGQLIAGCVVIYSAAVLLGTALGIVRPRFPSRFLFAGLVASGVLVMASVALFLVYIVQ